MGICKTKVSSKAKGPSVELLWARERNWSKMAISGALANAKRIRNSGVLTTAEQLTLVTVTTALERLLSTWDARNHMSKKLYVTKKTNASHKLGSK